MATQKLVIEGTSVTASQVSEMFRQFGTGELTGFHVQAFIEHRDPFGAKTDHDSQLASWCVLLKNLFGIEIGPNQVKVPERQLGFDRLIVVPKGLTLDQILAVCRKQFGVYCYYDDLDKNVTQNDRTNNDTYAIWVRERVEADEELKNLSADQLKEREITGITLMERLLLEIKYFSETGKHLDLESITLCAGSRYSDGCVPHVYWYVAYRKLYVHWYGVGYRHGYLRARAVVS